MSEIPEALCDICGWRGPFPSYSGLCANGHGMDIGNVILATASPKAQHVAALRAEARRLSEALEMVNRKLTTLGAHDG